MDGVRINSSLLEYQYFKQSLAAMNIIPLTNFKTGILCMGPPKSKNLKRIKTHMVGIKFVIYGRTKSFKYPKTNNLACGLQLYGRRS